MDGEAAEFLWKASRLVSTNSVLQCHYLTKCRSLLQGIEDVHIPGKAFRKSAMCNFCSNLWIYGRCHVSVMPKKVPGKKMKKIIQKQELSQALRPFENKLFEKYKKEKDNRMVFKCLVCKKRTFLPLRKPVKLKPTEVQSSVVETPVQNKKKKKKKKKDTYAGLNRAIILAHTPKREVSLLKGECKNLKENKIVDISPSVQPAMTSQEEQPHSRRRKRKGVESSDDLALLSTAGQKVQKLKSTVREQIAQAKWQIIASRKKNKNKMISDLENTAKKTKRCNALQNIFAAASAASQSTRPTLKEFLASLN